MRLGVLLFLLLLPVASAEEVNWSVLLRALHLQESSGKTISKPGDQGQALGQLQIHSGVIDDVNRIYGFTFTHADAQHPVKARCICVHYLRHWGKRYSRITGHSPDYLVYARIWNGGPNGFTNDNTLTYLEEFQVKLKKAKADLGQSP